MSTPREELGKMVRAVWIEWAEEQPIQKGSWLKPWEELSEPDKEVDRRIGEFIAEHATASSQSTIADLTRENERLCTANSSYEKEVPQLRHTIAELQRENMETPEVNPVPAAAIPWAKLPEWVTCAAMDEGKQWTAYEITPIRMSCDWRAPRNRAITFFAPPFPGDWRDSLQERPTVDYYEEHLIGQGSLPTPTVESATPETAWFTATVEAALEYVQCGQDKWKLVVPECYALSLECRAYAVEKERDEFRALWQKWQDLAVGAQRERDEWEKKWNQLGEQAYGVQLERDSLRKQLSDARAAVSVAKAELASLPADWHKDSSLETWFPYTAQELSTLRAQLKAAKPLCDAAVAMATYRSSTTDQPECIFLKT